MRQYFCIVAKGDVPIFQQQLANAQSKMQKEDLLQFIVHASLDAVDARLVGASGAGSAGSVAGSGNQGPSLYLKQVDKFNDLALSAFVTPGYQKFLLLHDQRTDEHVVKAFFYEVFEAYIKVLMNPFYTKNTAITSVAFDDKVRSIAEKYLGRM